jgi:hypothetical protein
VTKGDISTDVSNFSSYGLMQSFGNLVSSWAIMAVYQKNSLCMSRAREICSASSAQSTFNTGLFDVCPDKLRLYIGHMRRPSGMSTLKVASSKH